MDVVRIIIDCQSVAELCGLDSGEASLNIWSCRPLVCKYFSINFFRNCLFSVYEHENICIRVGGITKMSGWLCHIEYCDRMTHIVAIVANVLQCVHMFRDAYHEGVTN